MGCRILPLRGEEIWDSREQRFCLAQRPAAGAEINFSDGLSALAIRRPARVIFSETGSLLQRKALVCQVPDR